MDAARIGRGLAVEHVETGRFAGAVRADQREDFTGVKRKGHAAHGMHAAIGFAQTFDRQQWLGRAHSADSIFEASTAALTDDGRRRQIASTVPTNPRGKATTIRTMKAPSTSFDHSVWLTSQIDSAL